MLKTMVTAVIVYLATSIDEIPVLFMLYTKSSNKGKGKTITLTYFIGTLFLVAAGLLGALGLIQIPVKWAVGLIGLLPIIMGIKILVKGDDDDEEKAETLARKHKAVWAQVFIITLALGADDLGVYIPLFTTLTGSEIMLMLLVFAIGVAVLCLISYQLTHIEKLSSFIENKERFIVGSVFVAVGIMVMIECGTFTGILRMIS